jgi:4'-phosphopantetheinyl transferase
MRIRSALRPRRKSTIPEQLTLVPEIQIPDREVHIWLEQLPLDSRSVAEAKKHLSNTELIRADRFHHRRDHDRYVAAHARLRQILSKYTGIAPSKLTFELSEFGKPSLESATNRHLINFNLSHSGEWLLLGVVRKARIGVDIEEIKPESATSDVAERFFTKRENAELQSLPPDQGTIAFFHCWTRKEAYLKALGCGLSISPTDCDVTLVPTARPEIRQRLVKDAAEWFMFDLSSRSYAATAAIDEKPLKVQRKSG